MEILNVKVEKDTVEKIERLVKRKAYKNKSAAVREILEDHLREHPELFTPDIFEVLSGADKMSDREFEKMAARIFKGPRTAAQLVGKERER